MDLIGLILELSGKLVALGVLVEKIISDWKNWDGTPEIKLVRDSIKAFEQEMRSLNGTIKTLVNKI